MLDPLMSDRLWEEEPLKDDGGAEESGRDRSGTAGAVHHWKERKGR